MTRISATVLLVASLALRAPGVAAEGCAATEAEEQCQVEAVQPAAAATEALVEDETSLLGLSSQVHVRSAKKSAAAAKDGGEVDPILVALPEHPFTEGTPEERLWEAAAPKLRSALDAVPKLLAERKADVPFRVLLLAALFLLIAAILLFITCLGLLVERLCVTRPRWGEAAKAGQLLAPAANPAESLLQGACSSYGAVGPDSGCLKKDEHLVAVDTSFLMRVLNFTTGKGRSEVASPEDNSSDDCSQCPRPAPDIDEEEPEGEAEFLPSTRASHGEADAEEEWPTRSRP
mmetsp:Transcript_14154/g.29685  ORF Transcript_14154/g.29685 Transcript_14154/m.29685 type:complete len:290 (+) Transcript_14154:42-911(+)